MKKVVNLSAFSLLVVLTCFRLPRISAAKLPQEEVDALQEIVSTMGSTYWKFDATSFEIEMVGVTPEPPEESERKIVCDCSFESNTVCHVTKMTLKRLSLPGVLPPQLVKLPYLQEIDFAYNLFNGTIPKEWASMNLTSISLLVNRLSGEIPEYLGNITTLTYLMLEGNQFSGVIPPKLGNLINLQTLSLSSNQLTGSLPVIFAGLHNLTDFRINDNNFTGTIPNFIQNWKLLQRLRISDIISPSQSFPLLENMQSMTTLVLRNCNLIGEIPSYIWTLTNLATLDVSFNKLVGEIPPTLSLRRLRYIYLTGNMLSGNIPDSILKSGSSIDLSYNNFTWQGPQQPACQDDMSEMNLNLNLFRSFRKKNKLEELVPCSENFSCRQYSSCLHINSGGKDISVKEDTGDNLYLGDGNVEGGTATYYYSNNDHWGFSSTGDFMDDFEAQNIRYAVSLTSSNMQEIYKTARISPLSLTYFHNCMENGNYTVNLHFAEIQFTNDNTYKSLGKRIFDIYVQEQLVQKNFNIESETNVAQKPLVLPIHNVSVTDNILEIRFHWAGKGTTRIPDIGVYGPLISAVSVVSDSRPCSNGGKKSAVYKIIAIGVAALCFVLLMAGIIWWKGCFRVILRKKEDIQIGTFSLKQMRAATNDFSYDNKIGEGGFGPVYKGQLPDGTVVAIKQLSSMSRQGNREFLNEIGLISCLQHPNLVKLYGSCIDGDQLLLIYEYMENNNLARALGYMAPEYALWGHLTYKADVYSFGVVALEIVTGKSNNNYVPNDGAVCLLDWACQLQQTRNLMKLVDERLDSKVNEREAEIMIKVALLCTNASPSLRPTMSEVVNMLEGQMDIPDVVPEPNAYNEDLRFKALRDLGQFWSRQSLDGSQTQTQSSVTVRTFSLESGNTSTAYSTDHKLNRNSDVSSSKASQTP
ncbi:putative LRR receptor-like serine/threonine-protein kinase RFK1 isoform X2 [Senna tora]|uniref:non-specific serine/threonine protein kinase n=1 Tax=Senna tora TaxID=362788 RepID=A0A834SIY7_9FABA|nr:putative LRR receptor-like serine/threonine-protein kinase RFK1 isoform X2 [Senna tora]